MKLSHRTHRPSRCAVCRMPCLGTTHPCARDAEGDAPTSPLRADWRTTKSYQLEGSYLELLPQFGTACFYVVDWRDPDRSLSDALHFDLAKDSAERLLVRHPELYDVRLVQLASSERSK